MKFRNQLKAAIVAAVFASTSLGAFTSVEATSNTVVHSAAKSTKAVKSTTGAKTAKTVKTAKNVSPTKTVKSTGSTSVKHMTSAQVKSKSRTTAKAKESVVKAHKKNSKEPQVRVLLGSRTASLPLTVTGGAQVEGASKKFSAGSKVNVSVSGNTIKVNGKSVGNTALIRPKSSSATFSTLGQSYYGGLKVIARNGGMRLINEVGLEDYVAGVLPYEMSPSWPQAALQAQAVAARTYALYNMAQAKGQDYDVTPSTDYQVYKGSQGESANTRQAVRHTQGMVMTYGGQAINALFHSDGGGYTEDAVNVWGNNLPYLKGVKDYSTHASTRSWLITTSRKDLESKLRAAGKNVGTLKKIELTPMKKAPMSTSDRGVSGRVKQATFIGSSKKITLTGEQLRSIFGLKSTLFDFYVNHKPSVKERAGRSYHTFSKKNDVVYILGHGWGHGLGLSQWGAYEMAQKAPNDNEHYKEILHHYYTGVSLEKWY